MKRKKFVENPLYKKFAELLFDRIQQMQRGDLLKHEEIKAVITFEKDSIGWVSVLKKCRVMLRNVGVVLVPVAGIGYKVPMVDEQAEYITFSRSRRAIKQLRRQRQELEPTPTAGMSMCGQMLRSAALERAARQEKLMRADYRGLTAIYDKDDANKTPMMAR